MAVEMQKLTNRQRRILVMYDKGLLLCEIADAIGVHKSTVSRDFRAANRKVANHGPKLIPTDPYIIDNLGPDDIRGVA